MTSQRIIMKIVKKPRNQGLRDDNLILFSNLPWNSSIYNSLIFFKVDLLALYTSRLLISFQVIDSRIIFLSLGDFEEGVRCVGGAF